jgi:hypothetical protein
MRTKVNEAASILVCFSAARQRSELLAKAIIASKVRTKIRALKRIECEATVRPPPGSKIRLEIFFL